MKSRLLSLREGLLLGAPVLIVVVAGVCLSKRQNEQRAEQHRLESGPLRLNVWNVRSTPVANKDKKVGYNFSLRIGARVEGFLPSGWMTSPQKVWRLGTKSAQIFVGGVKLPSRMVGNFILYNPTGLTQSYFNGKRDATYWLLCNAPTSNAVLEVEFVATGSDVKSGKALGPRVVAAPEKFALRPFDSKNDAANNWKSEN